MMDKPLIPNGYSEVDNACSIRKNDARPVG